MFIIEDNNIYATRGDIVFFGVSAEDDGVPYHFQPGDVLRIKVYGKKDAEAVYLEKDFPVLENCESVEIFLTEEDTRIGEIISKPVDYWYEVCLNPETNPQTIIGYSDEGAAVFRLFPEGADIEKRERIITERDIPVVDEELDLTSTRPVSNKAVTAAIEKIKRDSKKDYVTPQMFGAVGDGKADDTAAVTAALETGETVVLSKTYRTTTINVPMGADVVVNGTLIVEGTINICYPDIRFTGKGKIKCDGDVCFTIKGAGKTPNTYCKNFYIGEELTVYGEMGKDNTGFLITADKGTGGVVVYPVINCIIQGFKYGIHSLYSGSDGAWFTSLRCGALIENCRYAMILDWHGTGSVFDGIIQPIVVENPGTDELPLVKISSYCTVRGMVWDMGTAPNKYAVWVDGEYNTVEVTNYAKYVYCKKHSLNNITDMKNRRFGVSSALCQGGKIRPENMPFDNTNDLAINAGNNKVGLTVTPSLFAGPAKSLLSGKGAQGMQWYFEKASAPDGIVLEFEFPENVALRQILVSGEKLPDEVKFEYKNTSGEWVYLKTCVLGEDFFYAAGQENYAWWQFAYSYADGLLLNNKFAKGVRITMNTETTATISRIHIGSVAITAPTKMGDDLIATSFKIRGSDGKFYDVTVQNGSLVATAEG